MVSQVALEGGRPREDEAVAALADEPLHLASRGGRAVEAEEGVDEGEGRKPSTARGEGRQGRGGRAVEGEGGGLSTGRRRSRRRGGRTVDGEGVESRARGGGARNLREQC